ncbi:NAD(P)H-dependent oxidoreductase [Lacticaseibacillus zhaodongensis]|uniref:NAD(P)H-dependent oxidoreductase n=1 Tax=Lacticaseibacillus zhaodongensis TaxID=2668065 RepID=UPI0012D2CD67|nr:NAD(P)H-dependent oxidoreductase [Lacticaseibacillus zhaodongensis]
MHTLIAVAHPHIARSNTQSFLKETAALEPTATWHELDGATLNLAAERKQLLASDRIVLQFPLYWYSAPAALWNWLDQVWVKNVVYGPDDGLLQGKSLGLVVSYSEPPRDYDLGGKVGLSMQEILRPFAAIAKRCGLQLLSPLLIPQFDRMTEQERAQLLVAYRQYLTLADPSSQREQAAWFEQQLRQNDAELLADTLADQQDKLLDLRATVSQLRAGEEE